MKKISYSVILSGILIYMSVSAANAQMIPPRNVDPGVINSNNSKNFADLTINKSAQKAEGKIDVQEPEVSVQPKLGYVEKIKLNKIVFLGNTVYSSSTLEKYTKNLIGKDDSPEEIVKAIKGISDFYHSKGYLTSFAYTLPQDIKEDVLTIRIFEGKVGEINITGTKWTKDSYIKNNIFKANNMDKYKIFNVNNLNSSLKDLNKNDYLQGQVSIQKGDAPETTDIMLNLKERIPLSLGAGWDNLGEDLVGVQRANITLSDSNLTGFGDTLSSGVSLANGTLGVNSGYSIPLGPYGTKFNFGYSYSKINVGGTYQALKIQGTSHLFSPSLVQPIYKTDNLTVDSSLSFDMSHSITNYLESIKLQGYDIRALRFGLNVTKNDNSGTWLSRAVISTGIPLLGATTESGYGIGSSKFVKFNTSLTRVQALPFRTMGLLRVAGQISPNALLAPEQIQLGGMNTVRGYDEGILLGDIGYNAGIEIRKPVPYLPDLSIPYWKGKKFNVNLKDNIQFALFYDQGLAKPIHQQANITFLQGIGPGLRINLTKYIIANLDLGIPLGRKISPNQHAVRFHFGLSTDVI